jgi:hypothetical protein
MKGQISLHIVYDASAIREWVAKTRKEELCLPDFVS